VTGRENVIIFGNCYMAMNSVSLWYLGNLIPE
jgi:hypothetical protein